tara:strand:+ start:43 stop:1782 length:1740 start_codon:yes stop_codon:yes gene_type:complete
MANGRRGGIGTLGFPQFNAGGQGGVIPQLQLRPAPINFPRPSGGGGGGRRQINPAVAFLPGIVGALGDRFLPQPDIIPRIPTGNEREDKILATADRTFGPDRAQPTLMQDLLPIGIDTLIAAGLGDRGGLQYANLAVDRRAKQSGDRQATRQLKQEFISRELFPDIRTVNVLEQNAARANIPDKRIGRYYKNDPNLYVPASSEEIQQGLANDEGFRKAFENESWIEIAKPGEGGSDPFAGLVNKDLTKLREDLDARKTTDASTVQVITLANPVLDRAQLDFENVDKDRLSSTGLISDVARLADDAKVAFNDISTAFGFRNTDEFFATTQAGGSVGRTGTGIASQSLFNIINNPNATDEQILNALNNWSQTADVDSATKTLFDKDFLDRTALNNVRQKAHLLQLAYLAAAANGQTGRTLSDKDLAYHLQLVGYGATQNAGVLHDNLINFVDLLIANNDNQTMALHNPNTWNRYRFDSEGGSFFGDELRYIYTPKEDKFFNDQDKLDENNYTFRNFYTRYKNLPTVSQYADRNYLISEIPRANFDIYFPDRNTAAGGGGGTATGGGSTESIYNQEIETSNI